MLTDLGTPDGSPDFPLFSGLVTGSILLGAMIGSLFGSTLADKVGRRMGMLIACGICIFGLLTQSFAPEKYTLLVFRGFLGGGIGLVGVICPLYVNEKAPSDKKGVLGVTFQLVLTFGIVLSNLVGWALLSVDVTINWRLMTGIGIIFPIALLIFALLYVAETKTPRYVGVTDEESTALTTPAADTYTYGLRKEGYAGLFCDCTNFKFLFLGIVFSATLQLTGINAVMFYGPQIIKNAGIDNGNAVNIGVTGWNFLTTFIAVLLVERLGRKFLMIGGAALVAVSAIFMGVSFHYFTGSLQAWTIGAGLALYLVGFEGGPGCLFWVLVNEAFPPHIRAAGNSFCNIVQWGFNLAISVTFPILNAALQSNAYIIFYVYGGIGVSCCFVLLIFLKETKEPDSMEE